MLLFDFLRLQVPGLTAHATKIHLARHNSSEDPLDVFIAGRFEEWQRWQTKRNFSRPYVVSLIQARHTQRWLYAGTFTVEGIEDKQPREEPWMANCYRYDLKKLDVADTYGGRMYVNSVYKGRTSYLNGETLFNGLTVQEISPVKLSLGDFPGYRNLSLTREQLDIVIRNDLGPWRTALKTVKGVYLITDTLAGKLYVGIAGGAHGFWGRWNHYSNTVHGGNEGLIQDLGAASPERLAGLRFSILEVMDPNATKEELYARETHWKEALMSRVLGHNFN